MGRPYVRDALLLVHHWPVDREGDLRVTKIIAISGQRVAEVLDEWDIIDNWWRPDQIKTTYIEVLLENGQKVVIYQQVKGPQPGIGWRRHSWAR